MPRINPDVFKAYDIRGVVDRDFDEARVEGLARACGAYFRARGLSRACLGHDARHSSPAYMAACARGLSASGVDVVVLDMVPTPVFYFACVHLKIPAGIMVTASHNPPEYNGFKVWAGASTIYGGEIQEIRRLMEEEAFVDGRGVVSRHDIVPAYVETLAGLCRLARPVKVVLDGGNGAGGLVAARLLRELGAEVVELYTEPDGDFPNHHPDPTLPENMADCAARVRETGAAAGIGLDGDGDRIAVADEQGRLMPGDELAAVLSRQILAEEPGAMIIGDVKCSHRLFRDVAAHGGEPLMSATGHSLMKAKLAETGAAFAGEMSGHMFYRQRFFGFDDALYSAARFCEILSAAEVPVSQFLADWPQTFSTPEIRMQVPEPVKFPLVARAVAHFREKYPATDLDGIRIDFPDGWALVRASNTQDVLVMRFESESEAGLARIRAEVEGAVLSWLEEMKAAMAAGTAAQ
ncbi:phosphoglucomutase/phosphomannomutase alpha/beta/alpha domain I [Desulfovibrio sp. X2]|uniref:phosphomannomutase/phosphoglucomutase n=1 Tax=Desulfovibrio sp. X2 TaxID=941449 RepID=UPI00035893AC|nr:phosphomannomutase/phosphoglucomutase [Desulfovibrio sp. X2]EPR43680.1 phosphoglucomutase/phosphomannomutase alpha/beta/alpha domain I [Desulfovibrio sp. X2]